MSDGRIIRDLEARIERLQARMAKNSAVMNAEWTTVGAFETGRSRRSPSLERRHQAAVDRRMNAYREYAVAKSECERLQQRLDAYRAGRIHANGQPRASVPTPAAADLREQMNAFIRLLLKPGDCVAETWGSSRTMRVKRVNAKSITTELGSKWTYAEIVPCGSDGNGMSRDEFRTRFAAWKAMREAQP
jgi:hypothetical protein